MITATVLSRSVYTLTMFSPANSGVYISLASKSTVLTGLSAMVPLAIPPYTVNSCGKVPSKSAIVPAVLLVCLKSMLISTASPVNAFSTKLGSTFMITQLSTVIPSVTLPAGPSLDPHQLLLANRVPLV